MPSEPPSMPLWLDLANACLWCGDQARVLRPKTFALLRYLVEHPGQVLPKAALLEALWPETLVSDVVLAVCIRELRQALGDSARAPRFIETVHRRGYRFMGQLPTTPPAMPPPSSPTPLPRLAGRAREWDVLHGALATARTGVRQLLFITGEAGLGKTALVEAFLTALEASGPLWIGCGQCLDQYGAGEAYLPVLEALGRVCRGPGGQEVIALLGQQAPTWLVQMPGLVPPADLEAVQRRLAGATRDRMLRELAEALERLTARQPLVLVLEDLHWCDASTLDLLVVLARRQEPARLLLLGGHVSAPRCAAAGPSAGDCAPRVAAAWALCGTATPVAPRSGRGHLPGEALPGRPPPGRVGAPRASAHRGPSALHGHRGGGVGAPRLAGPGGRRMDAAGGAGRPRQHGARGPAADARAAAGAPQRDGPGGLCSNGTDMRCSTYSFICAVQEYAECIYSEPKKAAPSAPNTPHI